MGLQVNKDYHAAKGRSFTNVKTIVVVLSLSLLILIVPPIFSGTARSWDKYCSGCREDYREYQNKRCGRSPGGWHGHKGPPVKPRTPLPDDRLGPRIKLRPRPHWNFRECRRVVAGGASMEWQN